MSQDQPIDIDAIRRQLEQAQGPRYWRSLEELSDSGEFREFLHHEFPRLAPLWEEAVDRRSVLKLMAAGMALAGLTACGRQPSEEIVPYVERPENTTPGRARYYATSVPVAGFAHGVLAETHEGRPTKLEGNPDHPATLGASDSWTQAAVLSLYDPDRSQTVIQRGELATFGGFLAALADRRADWDHRAGRGLAVVTPALTSPSARARLTAMRERWPQMRHFVHEPVDRGNVHEGAALAFGEALEPRYHLAEAEVVLSLDADFMAHQPGFLRHARGYAAGRKPPEHSDQGMSRVYALESSPTISGSVADHRKSVAGPAIEDAVRLLARQLNLEVAAPVNEAPVDPAWIEALARDLQAKPGRALVLTGEAQPPAVHAIAFAINARLGALGQTLSLQRPAAVRGEGLPALAEAIDAGEIDSLFLLGVNPVYDAPADLAFDARLERVPFRAHWGEYHDETAQRCHWHVPATHPLESWADLRAFDGTASLVQPLVRPLDAGRSLLQMLAAVAEGRDAEARALLRAHWSALDETAWKRALHDGRVPDTAFADRQPALRGDWARALPAPAARAPGPVLQLQPDPAVWDGRYANNGWLQELPRPLTKLTWTNAALISPALAEREGLRQGDVVRLSLNERSIELPVYVLPGQPADAVSVSLGYGRTAAGRVGNGVGANAYRLRSAEAPWFAVGLSLQATGERRELATTQDHHAMEGRDLIRAADLAQFREQPDFAREKPPEESLYPEPWPGGEPADNQWGMSIDLNACIGCNACLTACQSENNIPIVGEAEVARGHDMHWIRVDRYFEGQPEAPRMVFQPVPCMHCENAPCEYVCPVEATQHSADGLNEMLYNRCVGTRYCSQNCPYKVRRFNWFDYAAQGAPHDTPDAAANPDVTVRAGGVMEKCTYCVQRINAARIDADRDGRPIRDGDVVTACQAACPTEAIVFGDIADPDSTVSKAKASPRDYALMAELNTRPRTTYLAAVRNPNPEIQALEGGGGAG